jgi:hypothetical protein
MTAKVTTGVFMKSKNHQRLVQEGKLLFPELSVGANAAIRGAAVEIYGPGHSFGEDRDFFIDCAIALARKPKGLLIIPCAGKVLVTEIIDFLRTLPFDDGVKDIPYFGVPIEKLPAATVRVPREVLDLYEFMRASFVPMTRQQDEIQKSLKLAIDAMGKIKGVQKEAKAQKSTPD